MAALLLVLLWAPPAGAADQAAPEPGGIRPLMLLDIDLAACRQSATGRALLDAGGTISLRRLEGQLGIELAASAERALIWIPADRPLAVEAVVQGAAGGDFRTSLAETLGRREGVEVEREDGQTVYRWRPKPSNPGGGLPELPPILVTATGPATLVVATDRERLVRLAREGAGRRLLPAVAPPPALGGGVSLPLAALLLQPAAPNTVLDLFESAAGRNLQALTAAVWDDGGASRVRVVLAAGDAERAAALRDLLAGMAALDSLEGEGPGLLGGALVSLDGPRVILDLRVSPRGLADFLASGGGP